jgi:hypothetical protein
VVGVAGKVLVLSASLGLLLLFVGSVEKKKGILLGPPRSRVKVEGRVENWAEG